MRLRSHPCNSRRAAVAVWLSLGMLGVRADGPDDNNPGTVRAVPPPGIAVPAEVRQELAAGLAELGGKLAAVREATRDNATARALLPDAEVYHKAVRVALEHDEFHEEKEFEVARRFLETGSERAEAIAAGIPDWQAATGLVARGYASRIDGSVQPYGLVVPESYRPHSGRRHRLDFWFHGRGEKLSELAFLQQRESDPGQFTPQDAFVLHLYGRYCNANKLAGEVDLFEALEKVREQYPGAIDEDRLVVRGFSMGGAACWQFAVHHAGMWAAAAPGAGFSETPEFLRVFQQEKLNPAWYERKLWHCYNCTDWAVNLFHCPTVAYSGEADRQKQAADIMAAALASEGMQLAHVIGAGMGHRYDAESIAEIDRRIDSVVALGREKVPRTLKFTTYTLRYNQMLWLTVDALEAHWSKAVVGAELVDGGVRATTRNVAALTFDIPPGHWPFDLTGIPFVELDGQRLPAPSAATDRSWRASFRKDGSGRWQPGGEGRAEGLRKRHGLQGPVDDAFLDAFLMVRPTGQPWNPLVGTWAEGELRHSVGRWRKQFRGEARVKDDAAVTAEDIASHNLVLWGDPGNNAIISRIIGQLPLQWTREGLALGDARWPADRHVPVMVFPNPLNPQRYVVLNSGVTFREYDDLNNARQVPKLPDWAIIDVSPGSNSRWPGDVVTAGFFDEQWRWQPRDAADR